MLSPLFPIPPSFPLPLMSPNILTYFSSYFSFIFPILSPFNIPCSPVHVFLPPGLVCPATGPGGPPRGAQASRGSGLNSIRSLAMPSLSYLVHRISGSIRPVILSTSVRTLTRVSDSTLCLSSGRGPWRRGSRAWAGRRPW